MPINAIAHIKIQKKLFEKIFFQIQTFFFRFEPVIMKCHYSAKY